jgi:uncharacterized protein YecT (DUF1311 family)
MSKLRRTVFAFLLLTLFASHSVLADEMPCDGTNQADMNVCAAKQFQIAETEMNKTYQQVFNGRKTQQARDRLQDSQTAWLNYREKACLYEVGLKEESGSSWPFEENNCKTNLTDERNEMLKVYIACTHEGCPY